MTLILKLMSDENAPDEDSRKEHILHTDIAECQFIRAPNGCFARGKYTNGEEFRHTLYGNAYVMNEAGKTISSFGIASYVPVPPGVGVHQYGKEVLLDVTDSFGMLNTIDQLGIALAEHDHKWTADERNSYEWAVKKLGGEDHPRKPQKKSKKAD